MDYPYKWYQQLPTPAYAHTYTSTPTFTHLFTGPDHPLTQTAKDTLCRNENSRREYEINVSGNYVDIAPPHNSKASTTTTVTTIPSPRKPHIPMLHLATDNFYIGGGGHEDDLGEKVKLGQRSAGKGHTSAWYHVPGRYPTPEKPYPPARSQKRVGRLRSNFECSSTSNNVNNSSFLEYSRLDTAWSMHYQNTFHST